METNRFSNEYAENQMARFHKGELSHNQIGELMDILQNRITQNRLLLQKDASVAEVSKQLNIELNHMARKLNVSAMNISSLSLIGAVKLLKQRMPDLTKTGKKKNVIEIHQDQVIQLVDTDGDIHHCQVKFLEIQTPV